MKKTLTLVIIVFVTCCMFAFAIPSIAASNDAKPDFVFVLNNAGTACGISANKGVVLKGVVTIPATYNGKPVTKIFTFAGQQEITDIVMPDSIVEIGAMAFSFCTKLERVTFSNNLEKIGQAAFMGAALKSIIIPGSVTNIGEHAFQACLNLTDITIRSTVVNIGNEAFKECTKLTNVTFEDSAASIGTDAFRDCTKLVSASFGNNLTAIGTGAFSDCGLLSITIPASVTSIGEDAFRACPAKYINVKGLSNKPSGWHNRWNFYEYGGHAGLNEIFFPVNWNCKEM